MSRNQSSRRSSRLPRRSTAPEVLTVPIFEGDAEKTQEAAAVSDQDAEEVVRRMVEAVYT